MTLAPPRWTIAVGREVFSLDAKADYRKTFEPLLDEDGELSRVTLESPSGVKRSLPLHAPGPYLQDSWRVALGYNGPNAVPFPLDDGVRHAVLVPRTYNDEVKRNWCENLI